MHILLIRIFKESFLLLVSMLCEPTQKDGFSCRSVQLECIRETPFAFNGKQWPHIKETAVCGEDLHAVIVRASDLIKGDLTFFALFWFFLSFTDLLICNQGTNLRCSDFPV